MLIRILLLFLVTSAAFSQEPERGADTTPTEQQASDREGAPSPATAIENPIPAETANANPACDDCNEEEPFNPDEHRIAVATVWLACTTLVLAAFTGGLMIYTARMWKATRRLTKDARQASARQAREMEASIALASDTAQRQLRAYLHVTDISGTTFNDILSSKNIILKVVVENAGQTPAYKVRQKMGIVIVTNLEELATFMGQSITDQSVNVIGPRGKNEMTVAYSITDQVHFDGLKSGAMTCYVAGEIFYKDAFKENRSTEFRYMFHKDQIGGILRICPDGNDAT